MVARRIAGMSAIAGLRGLGQDLGINVNDPYYGGSSSSSPDVSDYLAASGALPGSTQPGGTSSTGGGGGFWSSFGTAVGSILGSAGGQISQAGINRGVCEINPNDPRCAPAKLKSLGAGSTPWGTIALIGGGALLLIMLMRGRRRSAD